MSKKKITEEEKHELLTTRFTAPIKFEVIDHRELTEQEKKENEEMWKKIDERKKKDKHW